MILSTGVAENLCVPQSFESHVTQNVFCCAKHYVKIYHQTYQTPLKIQLKKKMHKRSECLCYLAMNMTQRYRYANDTWIRRRNRSDKKTQKVCLDKNKIINKPYCFFNYVKYIGTDSFL